MADRERVEQEVRLALVVVQDVPRGGERTAGLGRDDLTGAHAGVHAGPGGVRLSHCMQWTGRGGRPPKSTGHMGASTQGVNTDVYTARNPPPSPPPPPAQSDAPVRACVRHATAGGGGFGNSIEDGDFKRLCTRPYVPFEAAHLDYPVVFNPTSVLGV